MALMNDTTRPSDLLLKMMEQTDDMNAKHAIEQAIDAMEM